MKEHFEKFLGQGNATENPADLQAYGYDASERGGMARVVLFPDQEEQLRLILTYCNRSNLDLVLRGNGSNITGMTIPNNSIVVSTLGFDRIHAVNVRESWVKVDCGVTIKELNDALSEHGFRFPLEPFSAAQNTIGGFLARNGLARQSVKYGRAVENIVELEVIDGTGKYLTVVKDFADYVGKEGSAFMIVRAKLKIVPIVTRSADVFYFDSIDQALQKVDELMHGTEKPLAIEYLDVSAATFALFNTRHTILVEWESERGSQKFENYAALVHKRASARRRLGERGYTLFDDGLVSAENRDRAIRWCVEKELPVIAHIALGVIHPFFMREKEALRAQWAEYLVSIGESPAGEYGYGLVKKKYVPAAMKTQLRQLKERLDYNNIVGRGKLYDYI